MKPVVNTAKSWSTSSYGGTVDTSPVDLTALGDHLGLCKGSHGRLFALHCVAQSMQGFIAARFVTTLVVVALLISIATLAF